RLARHHRPARRLAPGGTAKPGEAPTGIDLETDVLARFEMAEATRDTPDFEQRHAGASPGFDQRPIVTKRALPKGVFPGTAVRTARPRGREYNARRSRDGLQINAAGEAAATRAPPPEISPRRRA